MEILKLVAISELSSISSYGEGLAAIEKLTYLSKERVEKYKQLFHYVIQRIMGYSVPPNVVISRELREPRTKHPHSLFYGFFEFRYGSSGHYEPWTYYRVQINCSNISFIGNNGEEINFSIFSGGAFLTHNYCVIKREEMIHIYHERISPEHRLFYGPSPIETIIRVVERPNELVFIYYDDSGMVSVMFYSFKKGTFSVPDHFTPVLRMHRYFCGSLGFYFQSNGKLLCQTYSDTRKIISGMPSELINEICFVRNEFKHFDFIYTNLFSGFLYNNLEDRILWSFDTGIPRLLHCDSFSILDNSIVDLVTGRKLFSVDGTLLSLTRKDDGSGYWVWVAD